MVTREITANDTTASKADEATTEKAGRDLPAAAQRALAEAAERRRHLEAAATRPTELRGRGGSDPVRYGDWEVKGLASDF